MARSAFARWAVLAGAGLLSGCGTFVPHMEEPWEHGKAAEFEADIQAHVFCEFARAVREAHNQKNKDLDAAIDGGNDPGDDLDPDDNDEFEVHRNWQASIGLAIQADEASSLNPGVSLVTPLPQAQTYSTTFGAQLQAQTTRIDTFDFHYNLNDILDMPIEKFKASCAFKPNSSLLSSGHPLRIKNWLSAGLRMVNRVPGYEKDKGPSGTNYKTNLFQYQTKFIVTSAGSVTPQWKLTRILTNQSAVVPPAFPFLSGSRMRTHDLVITMGPMTDKAVNAGNKKKGNGPGFASGGLDADTLTAIHLNSVFSSQIADQIASQLSGVRPGF